MPEFLAYASKTIQGHLCSKCASPMERTQTGKLGFRAFRCPQCSHMEELQIHTGVIPRPAAPRRASTPLRAGLTSNAASVGRSFMSATSDSLPVALFRFGERGA